MLQLPLCLHQLGAGPGTWNNAIAPLYFKFTALYHGMIRMHSLQNESKLWQLHSYLRYKASMGVTIVSKIHFVSEIPRVLSLSWEHRPQQHNL